MVWGLIIVIAVVVILALALVGMFNQMIVKRNRVEQAFSSIDVMLKNRFDLVPNLVATAERYMIHEADTLTRISALRSTAGNSKAPTEKRLAADAEMHNLLGGLRLQIENYPDLKANQGFLQLFNSLESLEGEISSSRRAYNAAVTSFNNAIEMFPGNMVAGILGFRRRDVLTIAPEERVAPAVKSLFNG